MHRRRRILAATLILASLGGGHAALAQSMRPASRDAALRALAARLHLPLVDEAVAIFSRQLRRTLPGDFVGAVGRNIDLGPQWRRGNPYFDEAVRQVDGALAAEEARGGPLVKLERDDLLYAVDVPWSDADIAFVDQTLDTPLGAEAERAIDAKAAQQTIATLKRRIATGTTAPGIAESFADLDARAQSQFADAFLTLLALKATDARRAQRLQRLIEAVTLAPSDAIGERVAQRLSQRLFDAAAAQLPNVLGAIAGFRVGS
jgi:hypothetical protein